ncbi:fructose-bisphosphate aldolase [miscellaneous Crenarchaeota group archaeon SMTZ-80]|nr:MAG: fructose-bisphosphate aldolase [miscellaneous Crenarchaeota group archaeon SMTZ-80]
MKGKMNRLARILSPKTGRGLIIAIDHGMALGPMTGIEEPARVFNMLEPYADAWLMTKGIFTHVYQPRGGTGIILRASGGATIVGPDITCEGPTASVEELVSLSADAIATSAYIGTQNEHETLRHMARVATDCCRWQVPLVGVIGVGKDKEKTQDPKFVALSARVAAEHGADIVKTYYTPQDFDKVTASCPVPIVIAGGPKCETDKETLDMIRGALDGGAAGIVMGRNIWQSGRPVPLIKAVRTMIHDNASLDDAITILHES